MGTRLGPGDGGQCMGCVHEVVAREGGDRRVICTKLGHDVGFYPANTWKCPYKAPSVLAAVHDIVTK